jgi:hypothetical protein
VEVISGAVPSWVGDGSGSGSGSGSGYGYGDGYGSGYGDGYGEYWVIVLGCFLNRLSVEAQKRAAVLVAQGAKLAYWRSDAAGRPANGGSLAPVAAGALHEEKGPLRLCERGTLHATLNPPKWKGERWWIVALYPPFIGDDDKYGSLKREIIGECI